MTRAIGLVVALAFASPTFGLSVIFDNILPNGGAYYLNQSEGSPASQLSLGGPFVFDFGAADDFVLPPSQAPSGEWTITRVRWVGVFFGEGTLPADPHFNLVFWPQAASGRPAGASSAGLPPVYSESLSRQTDLSVSTSPIPGESYAFEYFVDLPVPFAAQPSTPYWLEIQPIFDYPPQWGWNRTVGQQLGHAVQGFNYGPFTIPYWTPISTSADLAFSLEGSPVPEPTIGAGTLLLFLVWRRSSRSRLGRRGVNSGLLGVRP